MQSGLVHSPATCDALALCLQNAYALDGLWPMESAGLATVQKFCMACLSLAQETA